MKIEEKDIKTKLNDGWLKVWVMIESMAVREELSRQSLEELAKLIEKEPPVGIIKKDLKESHRVDNPLPEIPTAYSTVLEMELLVKNYGTLVRFVMHYAPSAIEILEPKKIQMELGEAQESLSEISSLIHRFAQTGLGGVVIARGKE